MCNSLPCKSDHITRANYVRLASFRFSSVKLFSRLLQIRLQQILYGKEDGSRQRAFPLVLGFSFVKFVFRITLFKDFIQSMLQQILHGKEDGSRQHASP